MANDDAADSIERGCSAEMSGPEVSHNLRDQRLGLKGRKTREKLLNTAFRMLTSPDDAPVILSSVAREASVALTTLYLYFPDMGELLLALLDRVNASAEEDFIGRLRARWPNESLHACCLDFLLAHNRFWQSHSRILLMRNSWVDGGDSRFLDHGYQVARPLIKLLMFQMDGAEEERNSMCERFATLLVTGFERLAAVIATASHVPIEDFGLIDEPGYIDQLISTEAELLAMTIRHQRQPKIVPAPLGNRPAATSQGYKVFGVGIGSAIMRFE